MESKLVGTLAYASPAVRLRATESIRRYDSVPMPRQGRTSFAKFPTCWNHGLLLPFAQISYSAFTTPSSCLSRIPLGAVYASTTPTIVTIVTTSTTRSSKAEGNPSLGFEFEEAVCSGGRGNETDLSAEAAVPRGDQGHRSLQAHDT